MIIYYNTLFFMEGIQIYLAVGTPAGILSDKTMDDKMKYIPNNDNNVTPSVDG